MGCASSAPPKTMQPMPAFKMNIKTQGIQSQRNASQHGIDFMAAQTQVESPKSERAYPEDSWQVREVPPGFPGGKLPPDRQLHYKHMNKLNKFLKGIQQSPLNLAEDVARKRRASKNRTSRNSQNSRSSRSSRSGQDLCDSPGSDVSDVSDVTVVVTL
ncbi:unnamed protein product [Cladocopium goreaui]|uniref:Uncharacterized protein n=1 Tax=Cladocopium goreaui TaxID=2562237 RepID=A0A9P1G9P8_9DINO|nr:unnamed protein product [Cladocopium goreaui]|mmetsp:Transcript_12502/g.26278  ORF Transcript_12502/g.26278 Transcript_12502/m.26278 type:complete len:158 (+) Transcript_12502:90-563(+)